MSDATIQLPSDPDVALLLNPDTVRARCRNIFDVAESGGSQHFRLNFQKLPSVVDLVVQECQKNYPSSQIPIHGRFRHFEMDGIDRLRSLRGALENDRRDRALALADLVIVSVLVDAGAGMTWSYKEGDTGRIYRRSEGLAVASLDAFRKGLFSSDPKRPLRVDRSGLAKLSAETVRSMFQVNDKNPLVGVEGRLGLLKSLGATIGANPAIFGPDTPRPGHIVEAICTPFKESRQVPARKILEAVLTALGPIWPSRLSLNGFPLGDVWHHVAAGGSGATERFVPFHKLSQWLTYSLVEPIMEGGYQVTDLHELTGLPEYRNGGLFLDMNLIEARDALALNRTYRVGDEFVVEWRALTICLLDRVVTEVRTALGKTEQQLPLANVLQGGTWSAGRVAARRARQDGGSPIKIESDGTVF